MRGSVRSLRQAAVTTPCRFGTRARKFHFPHASFIYSLEHLIPLQAFYRQSFKTVQFLLHTRDQYNHTDSTTELWYAVPGIAASWYFLEHSSFVCHTVTRNFREKGKHFYRKWISHNFECNS